MKALFWIIFTVFSIISLNSFASNLDTAGLWYPEIQAITEASEDEIKELKQCVTDSGETKIDNTSCINEIFGDVHN
jgi:hypothetical protein